MDKNNQFVKRKYKQENTLDEIVKQDKQHTRNYAKRQTTWLKKHVGESIFDPSDWDGILLHLSQ